MPELRLIIGPAGSGKTWRVVQEAAALAAEGPLGPPDNPPLLVVVPEQHAVVMERALLARLAELQGGRAASARLRVMSLSRLGNWLAARAGAFALPLSELGRRLLIWRLLSGVDGARKRAAQADVYAGLVAELSRHGTTADQLRGRAERLAAESKGQPDQLAVKLTRLAEVLGAYQEACGARGLAFASPAAWIGDLLTAQHWPLLAETEVWVDGFWGFTPVEESALLAMLGRAKRVSATILLDPGRLTAPQPADRADWYGPTRELHARWQALAAAAQADISEERIEALPRWVDGSPLASLARCGLELPAESANNAGAGSEGEHGAARAVVCADERTEVAAAARWIHNLVREQGLRYGEISVVCRDLQPYAQLIAAQFDAQRIPFFLDRREPLRHHPAVELLRCGLRLAVDAASAEDIYTLLKTDLLPGPRLEQDGLQRLDVAASRERVDQLENYAREHGLAPRHWLSRTRWEYCRPPSGPRGRRSFEDEDEEREQRRRSALDSWRREALAPVMELAAEIAGLPAGERTVGAVLKLAWRRLLTDEVAAELACWAEDAAAQRPPRPAQAEAHRGVLQKLAALVDEVARLAGDEPLAGAELVGWLEYGLGHLSLGYPPTLLDAVLVTDVVRGRHHPVRASLLLGLADDLWPPAAEESPLFADAERERINAEHALLGRGAQDAAAREPYLALVAATRASRHLHLSRPAADKDGRRRQPSPYFLDLTSALGLTEEYAAAAEAHGPAQIATPEELVLSAALHPADGNLKQLAQELAAGTPHALRGLSWGRASRDQANRLEPLPPAVLATALGTRGEAPVLHCSVSRLEAFAACPFKHYARYYLRLEEREEHLFGAALLGSFYHRVLELTVERLTQVDYDWIGGDPAEMLAVSREVAAELAGDLRGETGRERVDYVLERAGVLLGHQVQAQLDRLRQEARTPAGVELHLGDKPGELPPLELPTAAGRLRLSGYVDRVDTGAQGATTVVDYKLSAREVNWGRFLAGQQVQLFAYLLALEQRPRASKAEPPFMAAAAEYQPLEPRWSKGGEADFAPDCVPPVYKNEEANARAAGMLPRVLDQTRRILTELGERILSGQIAPRPLRDERGGGWRACAECEFAPLCRFDPVVGEAYREVRTKADKALMWAIAAGEEDFSGSAGDEPPPEVAR